MAAITKRFIWLHRVPGLLSSIHHHFSTSSDPSPDPPGRETDQDRQSTSSSSFNDVKASLRRESPTMRPQMQTKPLSFLNSSPLQSPPSKAASLQEIGKHISEFRRRSAAPPPSSSGVSDQPPSFQELYIKNISSQNDTSNSTTPSKYTPAAAGGKLSFDSIRNSLRQIRADNMSQRFQNDSSGKTVDPLSLGRLKESLKLTPGEMNAPQFIIGGSDSLPVSLIGKNKKNVSDRDNEASAAGNFVRQYTYEEMGKKLESLRPERKGTWFSLQELNDRLAKMRVLEEKENEARGVGGFLYQDLRDSLVNIRSKEGQAKRDMRKQHLFILGGTPSFMLKPPKDHLVEKYFHPDHMSSAEKLKFKLLNVRDEFKMSESDCGSARVQVAQLTTKIKHLSAVLHKKDKHSRKGLQEMVQRRKKLLKYLRRTDWDSYALVLSKLGLRDNPDLKA